MLLGGSPLRMLRLDGRGIGVLDQLDGRCRIDEVTGASQRAVRSLARRLLDGGLAQPLWDTAPQFSAADVTMVVPVKLLLQEAGA